MTDLPPPQLVRCYVVVQCTNVVAKPLCYTVVRSRFSSEERITQVTATLASIRKYDKDPQSKILLVEVSDLNPGQERRIQEAVQTWGATYLNLSMFPDIAEQRDSPFKGATELRVLEYVMALGYVAPTDYLIKVSGRYTLTEDFQPESWVTEKERFIVRAFGDSTSTILYGVPPALRTLFEQRLQTTIAVTARANISIEDVLFQGMAAHYQDRSPLGVEGHTAPGDGISCRI